MTTFKEVQFPPQISIGATGGPGFKTEIVATDSGFEQRNVNWSRSRGTWDVGTGIKTRTHFDSLLGFHYDMRGRGYGFRYKDWADYSVTGQTLIASTEGGETSVQLVKTYTSNTFAFLRTIYKPVSGTVKVYDNGSEITSTVNTVTGVVSFSARSAGHAITADFEFDTPVRFDADELRFTLSQWDAGEAPSILLIELKLDSSGQG